MATQLATYDFVALFGALVAGWSGHWLITPNNHPDATTLQYLTIWLQILAGLTLAVWGTRRSRRLKATQTPPRSTS
jgi:hypothetical protein